jgi:hypothetical protein
LVGRFRFAYTLQLFWSVSCSFKAVLTLFDISIPVLVTGTYITVFAVMVRILIGTVSAGLGGDVEDETSWTYLAFVLLMVEVVGVEACEAGGGIFARGEVSVGLVALTEAQGGVVERSLPAGETLPVHEVVVLGTLVAGVVVIVGVFVGTLAGLRGVDEDFVVFAFYFLAHFGLRVVFVFVGTGVTLKGELVEIVGRVARVAVELKHEWFLSGADAGLGGGVSD